jgi:hypothetical protein
MAESSQAVQYFPLAAQPDVVRSAQKDRLCLHILEASVTDVVQGLLGPAAVFRYRDALQALSAALYFGGSTGAPALETQIGPAGTLSSNGPCILGHSIEGRAS